MASRPFQFLEKKRSKIRKRAAKHFEGLAALSTHSTGRRAAVKTGCKPVHFSLDGCPLSCYFPGVWPLLRDTLSTSRSVGRGTGAFIYLPPFSETSPIFCSFPFTKSQPVFLPEQTGRKKHRTPFPPSATPAGITHYTLLCTSQQILDTNHKKIYNKKLSVSQISVRNATCDIELASDSLTNKLDAVH